MITALKWLTDIPMILPYQWINMFDKIIINKTFFAYLLSIITILLILLTATINSHKIATTNISKKLDYMYQQEKILKKELEECKRIQEIQGDYH